MFEKATKTVIEVGGSVIGSAKKVGSSIYAVSKEQGELAGMKVQKSIVEKRLQESYALIGKRYLEYVKDSDASVVFDVSDIVEAMQPDVDKLEEIEAFLLEKEMNVKKNEEERRQKKALDAYEAEKAKLIKALEMDIINNEEFEEKMSIVQKKYDNAEQIRRLEMQLQMDIISKEEYDAKLSKLLND